VPAVDASARPGAPPETLTGTLEAIRFHKSGFLIGKLDNGTSVKGHMIAPQVGMEYEFRGRAEHHPRWGETFIFTDYKASYPKDATAIRAYLVENCKWIGPEISKRLVNAYGAETLAVCKADPGRVAREVSGLTAKRAVEIAAMLRNNEADEELQLRLTEILSGTRVSRRAVARIVELWGREAPDRIRANPYALIEAVEGIGFLTADQVARKAGYQPGGLPRVNAGVLHLLKEMAFAQGHTAVPAALLLEEAGKLLELGAEAIEPAFKVLADEKLIIVADGLVSLASLYEDERLIAEKLRALAAVAAPPGRPDLEGLASDQREALGKAVGSGVFILTGAPGTGKTFTIKRIISSFPKARITLAAPTGKAAKRIFEQSGMEAKTIHKLLEPQKSGDKFIFSRGAGNPVPADLVVLDEVSMVDVTLMARLLEALSPSTRLILVGDTYQLPPVGAGNVLKDAIASGVIPTTELTIIKRQDEGLIIRNCHRIKNGEDIEVGNSSAKDFFFLQRESEDEIRETLLDLVSRRLPDSYKADPLRDIQVLSPLREKTGLSCKALNAEFQKRLNPHPPVEGCRFRAGDKVIQNRNNYEKDVINGDIGYVREIDPRSRAITVAFENPERVVELPLYDNDLELAYAVTVHKFQGSETPIVVIPVHQAFGPFLMQRNLLYTAVSRARKVTVLVGQRGEIPRIIARNQQQKRFTRLKEFLRAGKA
jgi:exodeoxyribonuclease V alpha subunit